jgi:vacuolar-type H+-ATPase subunit D/Vma8
MTTMNATTSLKLFDISLEFIKDKDKAREFVSKIEETIDQKFESEKRVLASKTDLAEMETRIEKRMSEINKTIYLVGLIQFLAIVGSVLAIITFMLK